MFINYYKNMRDFLNLKITSHNLVKNIVCRAVNQKFISIRELLVDKEKIIKKLREVNGVNEN
jgi:hypothetical protein